MSPVQRRVGLDLRSLLIPLSLAVSACAMVEMSRDQAIQLARAEAPEHARPVEAIRAHFNDVAAADAQIDGPGGDREVWAVYLRDCDPDCLSGVGTQVVVLDAVTGELLYTNVPAAGGEAP